MIDTKGVVYIGSLTGYVMALNVADGSVVWPQPRRVTLAPILTGMAISLDQQVRWCTFIFPLQLTCVQRPAVDRAALLLPRGFTWRLSRLACVRCLATALEQLLYVGTSSGVTAVNTTTAITVWSAPVGSPVSGAIAVDDYGYVYACGDKGKLVVR